MSGPMLVIANFATPYVVAGWLLTAVALGGYAARVAIRTRRSRRIAVAEKPR